MHWRSTEIRNTATQATGGGTKYYVSSSSGNDNNSGKSESSPWKTLKKVSNTKFNAGDIIYFKRGDTWRETPANEVYGRLDVTSDGVTYSAYGSGAKPVFMGSPENGADASKWTLVSGTTNIYRYATKMTDVGLVAMNPDSSDAKWGHKASPDLLYVNGSYKFFVRGSNGTQAYDIKKHLTNDLDFFCDIQSNNYRFDKGYLYLRSDSGNPGTRFSSIEFAPHINIIHGSNKNNVTIDNICLKYGGGHAIGFGGNTGLTVRNCEIGWIGGSVHYYDGLNGMVRYGNGIEIYGSAVNYTVENNYIYQCYDAGATHQITGTDAPADHIMQNVLYKNNLITDCIYNIEHFLIEDSNRVYKKWGENVLIEGNILRRAGYGFGITRPNGNSAANIQGRGGSNLYRNNSFVVRNNIIDRSSNVLLCAFSLYDYGLPIYDGNTYVNVVGRMIGNHNTEQLRYDSDAPLVIREIFGDKRAKVYFLDETYAFTYRGTKY